MADSMRTKGLSWQAPLKSSLSMVQNMIPPRPKNLRNCASFFIKIQVSKLKDERTFFADVNGLVHDHGNVVVADPKVVLVGVRSDLARIRTDNLPVVVLDSFADLKNKGVLDHNIRLTN